MSKPAEFRGRDQWTILADLLKRIKSLEGRSPFYNTGVKPNGVGGLDSNNYVPGVSGFQLAETPEFNSIKLRGGIVGNDALANPVDGKVGNIGAGGFALTASVFVELAGQNITVPAGFTQALVTAGASVFSYNPNTTGGSNGAGGDAIYCYVACGVQTSHANPVGVSGNGGYANSFSNAGFEFTGLTPGSVLRLSVYGCSAYQNIASHPDNYANAYASVIWLR